MKKNFDFDAKSAGILVLAAGGGAFVGAAAGKYAFLLSIATIAVSSGYGSMEGIAAGAGMMAGVGVQASNLKGLGAADAPKKYGFEVAKSNLMAFTKGLQSTLFIPAKDKETGTPKVEGLGNVDWELMRQLEEQSTTMLYGKEPGIDSLRLNGVMSYDAVSRER